MTSCPLPNCRRTDLPPSVGMPIGAALPAAHVRPDGEPCAGSPVGQYDAEVHALVVADDDLWSLPSDTMTPTHAAARKAEIRAAATQAGTETNESEAVIAAAELAAAPRRRRRTP